MMLDKAKSVVKNVHIADVLFACLWLYGWFNNLDHKYDLDRLTVFYGVIRAYILADKIDNSVNNTPKGMSK